jgi:hypothetical protein
LKVKSRIRGTEEKEFVSEMLFIRACRWAFLSSEFNDAGTSMGGAGEQSRSLLVLTGLLG